MLLLLNLAYNPPAQKLQFTLFLKTSLICLAVHCTRLNCILLQIQIVHLPYTLYFFSVHCEMFIFQTVQHDVRCSRVKLHNYTHSTLFISCSQYIHCTIVHSTKVVRCTVLTTILDFYNTSSSQAQKQDANQKLHVYLQLYKFI